MLGRFLLQLQVQIKTSLEVMNMNATYKVRSQHIDDFQKRNSIVIKKIYITHAPLGSIFFKIHYKTLNYLLN